ncbi:MAG: NAD(P)H-hydrate dehydratase [Cyclobacteriaceae bacterium]
MRSRRKSCASFGCGLLTARVPNCGYSIIQASVPEAMASVDPSQNYFSLAPENLNYSAIGIGPGLGTDSETVKAFAKVLRQYKRPMVIDADALNMLAMNPELMDLVPEHSILTPHPKEFERLAGNWSDDFTRLELLRSFSKKIKSIVILKGAYSSVAMPDGNVFFNSSGNPGMATGGSGDVLTGILTGLLAAGYSPSETALLGVFLHGLAGDLAVLDGSAESLIASDLIEYLPSAFKKLSFA